MDNLNAQASEETIIKPFLALDLRLPNHRVCLSDGLSEVRIQQGLSVSVYSNFDPLFGSWTDCAGWSDDIATEAPSTDITIQVADQSALPILANHLNQRSRIRIYMGFIVDETGLLVAQPDLLYSGEYDTASVNGQQEVKINIISAFERFFNNERGERLNLSYQQKYFGLENGLKHMVSGQDKVWWNSTEIKSNNTTQTPSATVFRKYL